MTLNRLCSGFLFCCALLFTFPALSAAAAPKTASQVFIYGQLPPPEAIHRVVSSGPPTDQLLFAVAPEKLPGFASLSVKNNPYFAPRWRALPVTGRLSGRGSTLSPETLLALAPDVIVDSGLTDDTYRSQAARFSRQTGIPYILLSGNLTQTPDLLRQAGALLGEAERTEQQAQLAEKWLQDAAAFADRQTHKRRFYLARGAKGLQTGLRGSIHSEAPELLGFENVADVPDMQGLAEVSFEQLLQWNPDFIIAQDAVTYDAIMQGEVWQSLDAVKNKQVFYYAGLPFGWLDSPPGLNRLLGLRRLQTQFEPESADLKTDTGLFFSLFYHSPLSEAQINSLLSAR